MNDIGDLAALCALARWSLQAAAVSIAVVEDTALHYVAADGAGAESIVGTRLAAGRGIAGFAAATGQSLTVRDPTSDPRFARDVGEATGYVPAAIQCIPIDADGEVIAVLSILDRTEAAVGSAGAAVPLEHILALGATLLDGAWATDAPGAALAQRLAALPPADRARAGSVVEAVLDAFER